MRSTVEGLRLLARAMPVGFWERVPGLRRQLIRVAIRLQNLPARRRTPPLPPPPVADEAGEWIRPTAVAASAAPGPPATTGAGHGKAMILLPSLAASGASRFVIDLLAHAPAVPAPLVVGLDATTAGGASLAVELRAFTPWVEELPGHLTPVERAGVVVALARAHGVDVVLLADSTPECVAARAALRQHLPGVRAVRRVDGTGPPGREEAGGGGADLLILPRAVSPDDAWTGLEVDRVRVIGFGIDAAPFDPARVGEERRERARERSGVPRETALVVFLGRLIARKRPLDVLALAGRFHPTEAHFLLVGDGPLAAVVDREIGRSGLPHVRRVAAEPDVPALLAAADAVVLPSEREGLPRVLLEALAAGTPVVATAVGLVASTLALTGGGVAVGRVADIDGLEQGLRGVLAAPPDPEAVRRAVVEHFDVKRMAAAYGELLWPR